MAPDRLAPRAMRGSSSDWSRVSAATQNSTESARHTRSGAAPAWAAWRSIQGERTFALRKGL